MNYFEMTNNDKETGIAIKDSRLRLNLPRKVFFLVIATIVIWALGVDDWIEYYIELGIYHYKVWRLYPELYF